VTLTDPNLCLRRFSLRACDVLTPASSGANDVTAPLPPPQPHIATPNVTPKSLSDHALCHATFSSLLTLLPL